MAFGDGVYIHGGDGSLGVVPAGAFDCSLFDGKPRVRNEQRWVYAAVAAKSGTGGAGSVGVVEGEHSRHQLFDGNAVLRAGVALGEVQLLAVYYVDINQPPGEVSGVLNALGEPGFYAVLYHKAVYHYFDRMLLVLFKLNFLAEVVGDAVHPDS